MSELVLPRAVSDLFRKAPDADRHPGLLLDKFTPPGEQKDQRRALDRICAAGGHADLLKSLRERRAASLRALDATSFHAETDGPLTLHLARASALENAGIHLHPLYGFCCLPASGLKGMARAWAETVWLADQDDQAGAWGRILRVFGWAAGSERHKTWRQAGVGDPEGSRTGAVVFHDAWPVEWPRLEPDITNNHHVEYYRGDGDPGDWESPVPVYFLAVKPGARFDFAVSPGPGGGQESAELVALASECLAGALCHAGAGAKTNAGYGRFRLVDVSTARAGAAGGNGRSHVIEGSVPPPRAARRTSSHRLTLATPAFLAGAAQGESDCDLRPATLRGLLRWWWRTLHAGHLDRKRLRELETAIWGDAKTGGALAISVSGKRNAKPSLFAYKDRYRIKPDFARRHRIEPPKDGKTTQGLFYASYGMDERNRKRWYVDADAAWRVTLSARRSRMGAGERRTGAGESRTGAGERRTGAGERRTGAGERRTGTRRSRAGGSGGRSIEADDVLRQGEAALWLLCRFGGVGSKARKGFGSFRDLDVDGIDGVKACKQAARDLREGLRLPAGGGVGSPKLEEMIPVEKQTSWTDAWYALDQVGAIYQRLVKSFAGRSDRPAGGGVRPDERRALGLPRRVGRRQSPPAHWKFPRHVRDRHTSPVHWSLSREGDGGFLVRFTAFPAASLPNTSESRRVLQEAAERAGKDLATSAAGRPGPAAGPAAGPGGSGPGGGPRRRRRPGPSVPQPFYRVLSATSGNFPKGGERVECVLLEEKTKKGGWRAKHEPSGANGPILNTAEVPANAQPGQTVTLVVNRANPHDSAFRWPSGDAGRAPSAKASPRGKGRGRRRR